MEDIYIFLKKTFRFSLVLCIKSRLLDLSTLVVPIHLKQLYGYVYLIDVRGGSILGSRKM